MKTLFAVLALAALAFAQGKPKIQLHQSASGSPAVDLTWIQSDSAGVSGNRVYRSLISGGPYSEIGSCSPGCATFTDSTVAQGVTYYYVVTAVCAGCTPQESAFSNEAQAVIPPGAPDPPTNLQAQPGQAKVKLSWIPSDTPSSTTRIFRAVSGGNWEMLRKDMTKASWVDSAVAPHTTYFYRLKAWCDQCSPQQSVFSNQAKAVLP